MTAHPLLLLAAIAVRNPFWPIGHDGVKETISAEPKIVIAADSDETAAADTATAPANAHDAAPTAAPAAHAVSSSDWAKARRTLRISGTTTVTDRQGGKRYSVIINGLTYGNGDLISINYNGRRFTWRVQGLKEGGTVKLVRLRAKELTDEKEGEHEK